MSVILQRVKQVLGLDAGTEFPIPQPGQSWHPCGHYVAAGDLPALHVVSLPLQGPPPALKQPQTDAEAIVFLHGYLQSSWTWRHNLAPLARHFAVHALCLPGFGWSDKPRYLAYRLDKQAERVLAALDALGVQRAHLVGNSLGGSLALQIALLAPARVGRLVLVNPASSGRYPMALAAALQHEWLEPLMYAPGGKLALTLGLRHAAYANLPVDRALVQSFWHPLQTPGAKRAALQVARHFNQDLQQLDTRLAEIGAPALLLWGRGDRIIPLASVQRLARRLGDARLELYDCSGHCPMEEEPLRFNREVQAFLTAELE
jgi:pimeloyl-ACP methyl ester carboxylesterase